MLDPAGSISKIAIFSIILVVCFVPIFFYHKDVRTSIVFTEDLIENNSRYLVHTSKCKIPDVDPFNSEIIQFFHPEKYTPCTKFKLLTYLKHGTLHINSEIAPFYSNNTISCCYSNITRKESLKEPDDHITISSCIDFKTNTTINSPFIMVKCRDTKTKKQIYENTHTSIILTSGVTKKLSQKISPQPFSILFVGIDSISRLNLFRSLPKTVQFLEEHKWFPLEGYNKIGDNTFPNLMGIFTGLNESRAYQICNPKKVGKMDSCPLIWKQFEQRHYVTGYAEDESWINTFNYRKKGFTKPPTDYYWRPYIIGSEKLKMLKKDGMNYCTGPESAGERILNIARDFVVAFKSHPSFAFFWMNTFSHNFLNSASGMDEKLREFLESLQEHGVNEDSFVFFLSDHGMRFGKVRYTMVGWLEERLPFIYISVPDRFKKEFPKEYNNLLEKRNKLTTPYDLHMTLQHILELTGFGNFSVKQSEACPSCGSFFGDLGDRSCEEAAIEQHWCTCAGYNHIDPTTSLMLEAGNFILKQIAKILKSDHKICAEYSLDRIVSSSVSEPFSYKNATYYLLVIETKPKAFFEATLLYDAKEEFVLQGGISRLDVYGPHSNCIGDAYLKKYCYCR